MNLQLKKWQIEDLSLSKEISKSTDEGFALETRVLFPKKKNNIFNIVLLLDIFDKKFNLSIKAVFDFKLDVPITEEFKNSSFPKVNAPAIAFPYLRAYISNLTLQSGFAPTILPSINFTNLYDKHKIEVKRVRL